MSLSEDVAKLEQDSAEAWRRLAVRGDGVATRLKVHAEVLRNAALEAQTQSEQLMIENRRLRAALRLHCHTEQCREYTAKTVVNRGSHFCIADCAGPLRKILGGVTEGQEHLDKLEVELEAVPEDYERSGDLE